MAEDNLQTKRRPVRDSESATSHALMSPPGGEELFRYMVESVKDYAIFAMDTEGRVVSWNTGAERIFGYTEAEIIGRDASVIFIPEDIESGAPEEELSTAASEGRAEDERWHIRKDGSRFWASGIVSPLKDETGNLRGFVKVARDHTERKEAEEALQRSQQELTDFFENAAVGLHWVGPDGIILRVNQAELNLLGYTREEYIGHHISEFHADPEVIDDILTRLTKNETLNSYEARLRCKDGSIRNVLISSNVLRENGRFIHTRCFTRDITERKRAEEARAFLAKAGEELGSSLDYQTTLASVARMIVPTLADWCAVDVIDDDNSVKRLAVTHVDPAKVAWAHELRQRYPEDPNAQQGVMNVLRTGKSELYPEIQDSMLVAAAQDSEHLQIMREIGFTSVMIVPLVAHGRTLGAISFISAESGRHYSVEDLALAENLAGRAALAIDNARLYRAAQQANRLKDEFLATLSHELRTPLTSILGWAHLLRAGQLDESSALSGLETIERNARAQSQLIDDLLEVSRIITGKLRLDIRQIDPRSFIEAAIEALRPAAEAKGVRLQKVMDTGVSAVAGDSSRLQQVVWNLLSNAIKFTPRGGRVQVRLERVNSYVEMAVSDTGIGIEPQFLPYVFDRFRQADQTTTRQHGGLGLGLAIVRHLVELHGGTVHVESAGEGHGATFTVRLPVVSVYQRSGDAERVHPSAKDSLPSLGCPERLDGLRVLIVDDEADTRELLKMALSQCGAEVTTVGSSQEALEAIKRKPPQILLSDIGMAVEDGYELIKKVRALPAERGGNIPAVALTAYARAEDRLRALRAGYQMHLPKPVELAELVAVVASLSRRDR